MVLDAEHDQSVAAHGGDQVFAQGTLRYTWDESFFADEIIDIDHRDDWWEIITVAMT